MSDLFRREHAENSYSTDFGPVSTKYSIQVAACQIVKLIVLFITRSN